MGTVSRSVIGIVALPLAFLPTAAWGATTVPSGAASAPATGDPGQTAAPTELPTNLPTELPTNLPPLPDLGTGTLARNPVAGAPGTSITVSSVTKCVDTKGMVGKKGTVGKGADVVMFSWKDATKGPVGLTPAVEKLVTTTADGSWTATVSVPRGAKNGDTYIIAAGCFLTDPNKDAFLIYNPEFFMVADAPAAPVAKPVKKNPSFTG